ncbi:hypothetical protein [Nonomuraea basaltis]|uniref:hypothetical protein n=1 Tax=Nonomuraea basaltis TaxID=2495887 RepID=UPI00110C4B71|nr:hypothetical protein [Nonomuraea basaltis]TMR90511.1 hypothetical protein EJK15_55000 [Nonomuraea basaltis]
MNVVLSYGMGANGTALLLRLLFEPATRPPELLPDLSNLIVITAQTGDEFLDTAVMVERHFYPLLAARRVRTVQVARAGHYERDGITVLDDTREPILCLTSGAYALSEELVTTATVPQSGGVRKHSQKFKSWVIDQWIADNIGDEPYVHVMGYDVSEPDRVAGDLALGLPNKIPTHPLVDWGWDWDACERYIYDRLGVRWKRSHCVECPFAFSVTKGGRKRTIPCLLAHPHQAMRALEMEYLAVACNPKQGLLAGKQLYDLIATWPGGPILLDAFQRHLDGIEWAVYDVRRGFGGKAGDAMARGSTGRSLHALVTGTRAEMLARLERAAGLLGRRLETDGRHYRVWWRRRSLYFPTVEHLLAVAPAWAHDKTNPAFPKLWRNGLNATKQLELAI